MALPDFLKRKHKDLFESFYDTNKNGVVTHSDFLEKIPAMKKFRGWSDDDTRLKVCEQTLDKVWNSLKGGADTNRDQEITLDEWYTYWGKFYQEWQKKNDWPEGVEWMKEFITFWFEFMDTSGDGTLDENEFAQIATTFGISDPDARASYAKFAVKPVNLETFTKLWLQYMTSNNPSDPGNFLFGRPAW